MVLFSSLFGSPEILTYCKDLDIGTHVLVMLVTVGHRVVLFLLLYVCDWNKRGWEDRRLWRIKDLNGSSVRYFQSEGLKSFFTPHLLPRPLRLHLWHHVTCFGRDLISSIIKGSSDFETKQPEPVTNSLRPRPFFLKPDLYNFVVRYLGEVSLERCRWITGSQWKYVKVQTEITIKIGLNWI